LTQENFPCKILRKIKKFGDFSPSRLKVIIP